MDLHKIMIERALYPAMERMKGNHVRTYVSELIATQSAPAEQLRALQKERLTKLLTTSLAHVPAYQGLAEQGLTAEEIERDPFAALQKFPVLRKRDFQKNPDAYLNTAFDKSLLIANATGGSTGMPVRFYMDRYDVEHSEAARWRGLSWWGITYGSRSVMVWGNHIELEKDEQRKDRIKERHLKNRTIVSAYAISTEKRDEYVRFLNRYQPEYLYGYATALAMFSEVLLPCRDQLHLKRLKAVVSTSETLHPEQREKMQATFGVPVVNEYGARDAGILGYECRCGGLHASAENVLIEILDPVTLEPLPAGSSGLVATTDLNNLAMPRLRYVLGDTATLSDAACPCGMTLPLIESLDGREDALLKLPNGQLVHGDFISKLARHYPEIRQYQIVQTDPAHAQLRVVLSDGGTEILPKFEKDVADFLTGLQISVEAVDDIPPSKSGKYRYAIREFDL
jgi:phenylacetate-CoA ligase